MGDTENQENLCPFYVDIQKNEVTNKWYVKWINSYHNHTFRKALRQMQSISCNFKDKNATAWNYKKEFGITKKLQTVCLSEEIQQKIEYLWFEIGLKKSEIFYIISKDRYIEQEDISTHLGSFSVPKVDQVNDLEPLFREIEA